MSDRPWISFSFEDLKNHFLDSLNDIEALKLIYDELTHRTKNRRVIPFKKDVMDAIHNIEKHLDSTMQDVQADHGIEVQVDVSVSPSEVPYSWDRQQRTVIELNEDEVKIVEAGPGAGKTAVACARVSYLIEDLDLEASKILLISFTRTAVKEIRDRVEGFAEDPANVAGLKIFTLDSFTWQVLRGLGDDEVTDLMGGYETNIKALLKQLKDGDVQLLDYLSELEHVVLDEGQDLVGDRADLAIQILKSLEKSCGVTVFADSAQAIYGFTDDSEQNCTHDSLTVIERIMQGEIDGFDRIKLVNVHRTNDPKLKQLFKTGRDQLLDKKESDVDGWKAMKQLITDFSHGSVRKIQDQDLLGKSDHLILYRTRAEVLMDSSFLWSKCVAHKLRMSGSQQRLHPWIGRLLGEFQEDYLGRDQFDILWNEKVGVDADKGKCDSERDCAWQLLLDNVGDKHNRVRVIRLREILSRDRPPIDFIVDEYQLPGPVLGTIHASKGREANQVNLMMPPDTYMNQNPAFELNPRAIAEEERVLFVGATRAKQKLMIGPGRKMYASRLDGGRTYKSPRNCKGKRMVELGLTGDIDITSLADARLGENSEELQSWLWSNAKSYLEIKSKFDLELGANVLFVKDDGRPIGLLSKNFDKDLWALAKIVESKEKLGKLKPGLSIDHIRMVGITTVVIPEELRNSLAAPWRHSGFLLAPVITGFPVVYFNKWNKG